MKMRSSNIEEKNILEKHRVIAVIGCSRDPQKPAHFVPAYLKEKGYTIVPVNPTASEILGEKAYPSLMDVPQPVADKVETVNVFRPREEAEQFVRQAIEFKQKLAPKLRVVWLQEGIFLKLEEAGAAEAAKQAGLILVENKCMKKEYERLFA
jgi:hypothetical protein